MGFWKKKGAKIRTFSDVIRGLQYSVNTAQQVLERHHLYLFKKYFNEEGIPSMREFKISPDRSIFVPEISLINQNSLSIDEMEIEFNARVNMVEVKEDEEDSWLDRACFDVDFSPTSESDNLLRVKIKFKASKQPEGVSRLVDEFDKLISPVDTGSK